jgi:naphthoate synthase
VRNAFRPKTLFELIDAFARAREDHAIGVVLFTGEGPDAFCSGGDQKVRGDAGYVGDDGVPRLNALDLQRVIRTLPKPVIALVAGYAIGGGHVLHLLCDLTIAADNARFGQTGPRVGSSTPASAPPTWPGWWARRRPARSGTCASSTAPTRRWRWGSSTRWCRSPSSRRPAWRGRADPVAQPPRDPLPQGRLQRRLRRAGGLQELAGNATMLFYMTEEAQEGRDAFVEKRAPDFARFPWRP